MRIWVYCRVEGLAGRLPVRPCEASTDSWANMDTCQEISSSAAGGTVVVVAGAPDLSLPAA